MGKAGQALRQTLKTYGISQNKLAVTLDVDRSVVFHGFHENRAPAAEMISQIAQALQQLDPEASEASVRL